MFKRNSSDKPKPQLDGWGKIGSFGAGDDFATETQTVVLPRFESEIAIHGEPGPAEEPQEAFPGSDIY